MESLPRKPETTNQKVQLLKIVEALKHDPSYSTIDDLHELRTATSSTSLSRRLTKLEQSVQQLHSLKPSRNVVSLVARKVVSQEVSRLAAEVESELQPTVDRETLSSISSGVARMRRRALSEEGEEDPVGRLKPPPSEVEKLLDLMSALQSRLSKGFDINLQELLLKYGTFADIEWVLCSDLLSEIVHEKAAVLLKELVLFNKDVFVGSFLIGGCVRALVSMGSACSLQVLSSLIRAIKSPLVDELEACGGISKIIGCLWSEDLRVRDAALDCVMEIGYFGRKEAIEAMINGGVVKRLMELQLMKHLEEKQEKSKSSFVNYVSRFAVQLEVGEGLRQREKRAFKQQILNEVREASSSSSSSSLVSDAESATIFAEVLWGSSP